MTLSWCVDIKLTMNQKSASTVTRRQLQQQQHGNGQASIATPLFGAVCATGILLAALFHRCARTQYGPCTVDTTRRTAVCIRSSTLATLPIDVPDTTLVLSFTNDSDPDGRLIENEFTTLQRSNFTRLRRLRDLGLVRCGIVHLERSTFIDLSDLRRLDLRNNRLNHLTDGPFSGISKLDVLLLSGNPLVELGSFALSGLTVSRVEFVDTFQLSRINESAFEHSRISSLILNRCNLDVVDQASWKHLAPSLRELVIVNNQMPLTIEERALSGFRLRRLMLMNDSLTETGFLAAGDHDVINLDYNAALWNSTVVPLTGSQKKTKKLSVSETSLVRLSDVLNMSMFYELEELDVSNNYVRVLDASEFSALDRLRVLDLSDNHVDEFSGDFEDELTLLEVLKLERNRLQTIPESLAKPLFDRVKSGVAIAANPLHYNCELRWLLTTSVPLNDITDNDVIGDVSDELFQCSQPVILNTTSDQSTLECVAAGDPAPQVTWSNDGVVLSTVEQSGTVRNVLTTNAVLGITRPGNYTCTAVNLAGRVETTIAVTDFIGLQSNVVEDKAKHETISLLATPVGFTITVILFVLLGYVL